jgi:multiphosphoryl transfer protein
VVGIVIVSHSARLAEGVAELAREMGGAEVAVELAGGLAEPEGALGTDATRVASAIERADSGDGVVVLMDLGSAVLSAEMALELLSPEQREAVALSAAPLVEGAVSAAVAARAGASPHEVAAEASAGLGPKEAQLGVPAREAAQVQADEATEPGRRLDLVVGNPHGLHARPAARFVRTVSAFDAQVVVTNATTGAGPASAASLNALATLGVREGHEITVVARGREAGEALDALRALADDDFGDVPTGPAPAATAAATPAAGGIAGAPAGPGTAVGPARPLRRTSPEVPDTRVSDPGAEQRLLDEALSSVRRELEAARADVARRAGEPAAELVDAHLLFLDDEALLGPVRRAIAEERLNAAAAWQRAAREVAAGYEALEDEYMQARAADVLAVAARVVAALVGAGGVEPPSEPGILVADDVTPADAAALDPEVVHGIVTARGGPTSHGAILARALGLPAVTGAGEAILAVRDGSTLVVDGDAGRVFVEPGADVLAEYERRARERRSSEDEARAAAAEPALTRDGVRIEVAANVGSAAEAARAAANGADGVGLLRTEFLFLDRATIPGDEAQAAAYAEVADHLGGRRVIVRTLDVGADKPLPALPRPREANPFLGVRGIRLSLAEPALLDTQLRAVLRAAAGRSLAVMFPMVATLAELRAARAALGRARDGLADAGVPTPGELEVGVMVEVPALALGAEAFAREVDFFSIGTNDLTQYVLAAERGNEALAELADALHPAVLRLVQAVAAAAEAEGKWVGVCGEVAADPVAVPLLVGLGVRELSVGPAAVPRVKQAVRRIEAGSARALAEEALGCTSAADVRDLVEAATAPGQTGS